MSNLDLKDFTQSISREIKNILLRDPAPFLVLIGGCSRSGKSSFAKTLLTDLNNKKIISTILPMDQWLVPLSQRKKNSDVMSRYHIDTFVEAVKKTLSGKNFNYRAYNEVTRELEPKTRHFHAVSNLQVIIIDGVISLADINLRELSKIKIYIECDDSIRLERLFLYYTNVKNMDLPSAKKIILERESEEVIFVKKTKIHASYFYINKLREIQ